MAASFESPTYSQLVYDPSFFYTQPYPQDFSPSTASDLTIIPDPHPISPRRQRTSVASSPRPAKRLKASSRVTQLRGAAGADSGSAYMAGSESNGNVTNADASTTASKPKRVRTGCLTCRERHLKCDEGSPDCQNCRRSNRVCKRGVRLNFIDTQVQSPPMIPPTHDWSVQFQDDSREIASEYKGGLGRYPPLEQDLSSEIKRETPFEFPTSATAANTISHQALPPIQPLLPVSYPDPSQESIIDQSRDSHHHHTSSNPESTYSGQNGPAATSSTSYTNPEQTLTPPSESRDYLNSPEEVLFMQVFVEEVGLWMDSMDPMKHVSNPFPTMSRTRLILSPSSLDYYRFIL